MGTLTMAHVPGFVLGRKALKAGRGLCLCEVFIVLGKRGAPFEASDLTSVCSFHLLCR